MTELMEATIRYHREEGRKEGVAQERKEREKERKKGIRAGKKRRGARNGAGRTFQSKNCQVPSRR